MLDVFVVVVVVVVVEVVLEVVFEVVVEVVVVVVVEGVVIEVIVEVVVIEVLVEVVVSEGLVEVVGKPRGPRTSVSAAGRSTEDEHHTRPSRLWCANEIRCCSCPSPSCCFYTSGILSPPRR